MNYLVDANLLSEPTKPRFVEIAVAWLDANATACVTSAVVMGEIWRGIDRIPAGRRRVGLEIWFSKLRDDIVCLEWTLEVAVTWGTLVNEVKGAGYTVGMLDTMIAATAKLHGLTVATRNVLDFSRCGVPVFNPYEDPP